MHFSPTSILSSLIASSFFILFLSIVLKSNRLTKWVGKYIYLYSSLIFIRLVVPFEFNFTQTIPSKNILPLIQSLLQYQILSKYHLYDFLFFLWVIGAILFLFNNIFAYHKMKKSILKYSECSDERVNEIISQLLLEFSIKKEFKVISIPYSCSPAITGLYHPIIIIPDIFITDEELYYILRHEIGHYYYKDIYVKAFIEILCSVYWWNPLIRVFKTQVSKALEIRNDCWITSQMHENEKLDYLECILRIAKLNSINIISPILGFSSTNSCNLKQRFNCVLNNGYSQKRIIHILSVTIVPLILLYLSFIIIVEPYYVPNSVAATTFEIDPDNSYLIYNGETYDFYINDSFVASINNITEDFQDLKIINQEDIP